MNQRQQKHTILTHLREAEDIDGWVPLPVMFRKPEGGIIARYGARIFDLRKDGHEIEVKMKMVDGEMNSWYRLTKDAEV